MSGTVPSNNPTGYLGLPERNPPDIITTTRDPRTTDYKNLKLGDFWFNKSTHKFWILVNLANNTATWDPFAGPTAGTIDTLTGNSGGAVTGDTNGNVNLVGSGTNTVVGVPGTNTLTITPSSSGYPITPYVVGPSGQAGYQTIQSAVNAASAAGGGIVYIQPGTYTENLNVPDKVHLIGSVFMQDYSSGYPVVINGTLTVDTSANPQSSYNNFFYLFFNPPSGDVFTFNTNGGLQSVAMFYGCTLQVNQATKAALATDGFPTVYLDSCQITSTVSTGLLFALRGGSRFNYVFAQNTTFSINESSYITPAAGSDIQYVLKNCVWNAMVDTSASAGTYFLLQTENTTFEWDGLGGTEPLINFGAREGAFVCQNGIVQTPPGSLTSSTSVASNSFFNVYNTKFNGTYTLSSNCKEKIFTSTFEGGSSAAITMSSAQNVSISESVINTSANPAVSGSGAGALTLNNVAFLNGANIAGTVTVSVNNSTNPTGSTFSSSSSGSTETLTVSNTSNTASSQAQLNLSVAGTSAGDAYSTYTVSGTTNWSEGVDNSDSDKYKLSASSALGTSDRLSATTTGLFTFTPTTSGDGINVMGDISGGTVVNQTSNTSNTASSNADFRVSVGGTSAGDAWNEWIIGSTTAYALGIDNSDSDKLKITYAAGSSVSPSTGTEIVNINPTGSATSLPKVTVTSTDVVVAGDTGTEVVIFGVTNANAAEYSNIYTSSLSPRTGYFSSGMSDTPLWWNFGMANAGAPYASAFNISTSPGRPAPEGGTVCLSIATTGTVTVPAGNLSVSRSNVGGNVALGLSNTDNTNAASAAVFTTAVGGTSGGSPMHVFNIPSGSDWTIGADNGQSDRFSIAQSTAALNTKPVLLATTAGEITKPLQPAFYAKLTTTQTNVTGDGTVYTVICDSEQFDQGGNYNNATGVFTAPVTARYRATVVGNFGNLAVTTTDATIQLTVTGTSASTYNLFSLGAGAVRDSNDQVLATGTVLFTMTAGDTAVMQMVASNGGSKTISVIGQLSGTQPRTSFMVELVC
jgi:hypothetical protein